MRSKNTQSQQLSLHIEVPVWPVIRDSIAVIIFVVLLIVLWFTYQINRPPQDFPPTALIEVTEGMTMSEISLLFSERNIIRSPEMLSLMVRILGDAERIEAGEYFFNEPISLYRVAYMLVGGMHGLDPLTITIPEGANTREIGAIFTQHLDTRAFDVERFIEIARPYEGYLFPDTYHVYPNIDEGDVVRLMTSNFIARVEGIQSRIREFQVPLDDVVIMASLLEEEAYTAESRKIISGILWKRLEIGMKLQVDATFPYIDEIGRNTFEVTRADLEFDSPYNTYKYEGLPIGPISNPGLDSLLAAVTPVESEYLFYLSDMSGNIYYAKDYTEHLRNKRRYLN